MVYVAVTEAAALVLVVAVLLRAFSRMQRQHARREDALIDRLLNATGRPWTPSPASELERELLDDARRDRRRWRAAPEQYPVE